MSDEADKEPKVMRTRRIVALAEKLERSEESSEIERRTTVFDKTSTLKEVFDWLRCKNESASRRFVFGNRWWNARLCIYEDEATRELNPYNKLGSSSTERDSED